MRYALFKTAECTAKNECGLGGVSVGSREFPSFYFDINGAYNRAAVFNRSRICGCQWEVREVKDE